MTRKLLITALTSAYLGAGLFGGLVMQAAVPAMNGLGVAYYAATWPAFLHCARREGMECNAMRWIPAWLGQYLFDVEAL